MTPQRSYENKGERPNSPDESPPLNTNSPNTRSRLQPRQLTGTTTETVTATVTATITATITATTATTTTTTAATTAATTATATTTATTTTDSVTTSNSGGSVLSQDSVHFEDESSSGSDYDSEGSVSWYEDLFQEQQEIFRQLEDDDLSQ
jgi:hypothetical protein